MRVSWITNNILTLHGALALFIVFLLPALEASIFVGFVFPGETAVILGGVLAFEHRITLPEAMIAASAGAIIGDSIGYFVGQKWGHALIDRLTGRFLKPESVHAAVSFVARRGGPGVVIGRFTTALRVLIPGAAGMSDMPYRKFVIFNVAGGIVWAVGYSYLGYLAGASFKQVEKVSSQIIYVLLAVVILGFVAFGFYRHFKKTPKPIQKSPDGEVG